MKNVYLIFLLFVLTFPKIAQSQNCTPIATSDLRRMLGELGYEVKDLNTVQGTEKYEIKVMAPGFEVPMGIEISPNKAYVWFSVLLGKAFDESSPKNMALLKRNAVIQPHHFYVSEKGSLMMAIALENKCVTNFALKKFSDALAAKVSESKVYWQQN